METVLRIDEARESKDLDFSGIPTSYYLLGLLSAFENRFQAVADASMEVISWKQFFAIICINLCKTPPTLRELSDILGSSHQNVKKILLKLQQRGFVEFVPDESDRRKQRIVLTERCLRFCEKTDETGGRIMEEMFRGIPEEDLEATIRTITNIGRNLDSVRA